MYQIGASASIGPVSYGHDSNGPSRKDAKSVTPSLTKDNVKLIDEVNGKLINDYIDKLMQPSIDEYNSRQKRKDRKINTSYTEWHKANENKGDMVYSIVFQYGEHENLGKKYYESTDPKEKERLRQEFINIYKKWISDWQNQFPSMRIAWAYIHFDEINGTPHLSTGVIPISTEFKRGPKMQISMSKCLEQCGIKRMDTKKDNFQLARAFQQFRVIQERDLKELGYEIKPYKGGKHQDCETYRQLMTEVDERKAKVEEMEIFSQEVKELEDHQRQISHGKSKKDMIQKTIPSRWGKEEMVVISESDFNHLYCVTETERINRMVKNTKKEIEQRQEKVLKRIELGSDETLREENRQLKNEVQEKQYEINRLHIEMEKKNRLIDNLKYTIKKIVELIQEHYPRLMERVIGIIKGTQEREERTR